MQADNFKLAGATTATALAIASYIIREAIEDRAFRDENYRKNWDMYHNHHERYFKKRLDEPDNIFRYRKKNAIKSNLCGFTVDLSAKYLYGKAAKVVRRYSDNKDTDTKMRELVQQFFIESFMLDAAKKAAIYGELVARFIPVDSVTKEQVVGQTTETTFPYPIIMEPIRTYPKLNKWGKLVAVVSQYLTTDFSTGTKSSVTELVVEDTRWTWQSKGVLDSLASLNVGIGFITLDASSSVLIKSEPNTYKMEDEFVLLRNNEDRKSDLSDIIDLNIALDESMTDKQHFFQKHGWPQLVTEVSLENVINSPNKIWEITSDMDDKKKVMDKMGFLTWDGKMADNAAFQKNLERNIFILSHTAAISTGDLEAIGQLRSGAALITAHSVAIHKTEAKQIVWNKNEQMFLSACANMDSYFHNTSTVARYPDLDPCITYPKNFVPGAELETAQINKMEVDSHFRPIRDVIRDQYGNLGEDKIEELYQEILQDSRNIADSTREMISAQVPSGNSDNVDPPSSPNGNVSGKSGTPMQKSLQQRQGASGVS